MPNVKGNRRAAQSEATRELIVDAATSLFAKNGYIATTVDAVAQEAGVVVQTIYNSVGNKAALLNATLDRTVSGARAPATVPEFMRERMAATGDAAAAIRTLADWFVEVNERAAPVFRLIHQAAAADQEIDSLERRRARQRLEHYREAAQSLRERGAIGPSSDAEAAATIWSIGHPETYRILVQESGWSAEEYRNWIIATLSAALMVPR